VPAALAGVAGDRPVDDRRSLCGITQRWMPPAGDVVWACAVPRDAGGRPLGEGLEVEFSAPGLRWAGPVVDLGGGLYGRRVAEAPRRGRQVIISCSARGVTFAARPRLQGAASYQEAFAGGLRGGGCSPAPPPEHPAAGLPGLLVLLMVLAGPRRRDLSGSCSRCSWKRCSRCRKNLPSWE